MKLRKRGKCRSLILCLCMILVIEAFLPMSTLKVQAASATKCVYTALGDSITAGDETYVKYVVDDLKKKYSSVTVNNLAFGGWTSQDLLYAITNSKSEHYTKMRTAIKSADIITLDIGSNDIMNGMLDAFAEIVGCGRYDVWEELAKISEQIQNPNYLVAMNAHRRASVIAKNVHNKLYNTDYMYQIELKYRDNFRKIINEISTLAPKAKVYVGNLYNPYNGAPAMYLDDYLVIDYSTFWEKNVKALNMYVWGNKKYPVVNLYPVIRNDRYIIGDYAEYNYDPHPNRIGHKIFGNLFIQAMN